MRTSYLNDCGRKFAPNCGRIHVGYFYVKTRKLRHHYNGPPLTVNDSFAYL